MSALSRRRLARRRREKANGATPKGLEPDGTEATGPAAKGSEPDGLEPKGPTPAGSEPTGLEQRLRAIGAERYHDRHPFNLRMHAG